MWSLSILLIAIQLSIGFSNTVEDTCPKDLVNKVDKEFLRAYQDSCFHFVKDKKRTYFDARAQCAKDGATLALVKNKDLNDFLVYTLKQDLKYKKYVWIGLNDLEEEGKYVWEDGTPVEWKNFHDGVGGSFGKGEDCIVIKPDKGEWHDTECSSFDVWTFASGKYAYICQYTPKAEVPKKDEDTNQKGDDENKTDDNKENQNGDDGINTDPSANDDAEENKTEKDVTQTAAVAPGATQTAAVAPGATQTAAVAPGATQTAAVAPGATQTAAVAPGATQTTSAAPGRPIGDDGGDDTTRENDNCPEFKCTVDCGMNGYKLDENACQICECNV